MSSALIDTYSLSSLETNSSLLSNVRTIVKFYIWPLLVLFGLTGNCLSILVLTRRRLIRTSTNNYLTVLATFDSCYLILTLILNFCTHPNLVTYEFTDTLTYILRPFADFSSNTATWLIICFTLERTLAVAKPIYAKRTCSVRRSRHLICTLLILCFLITLPTFFERNLVRQNKTYSNLTERINQSKQRKFLHDLHRFYLVLICVIIIWIPLIILCICNSILIWYVHRSCHFNDDLQSNSVYESYPNSSHSINKLEYSNANHHRLSLISSSSFSTSNSIHLRRHSRSINQKRRVTIILIVCLFIALLLWTPQSVSLTYETFIENFSDMSSKHRIILLIFNNFANLFLCLNASIDFILYCFLSENFARTCKQMIVRQCSNEHTLKQQQQQQQSDRMSFVQVNPSNNIHQQQLAANTTNKYYIQLYDFYRNTSDYDDKKKWKKKFTRSITSNMKIDKQIFYQQNLTKDKDKFRTNKSINVRTNSILDFIDQNKEIDDTSNTLMTNSAKQSRSGTLCNV